ncbi:MAG: PAS domain S-box protein [Bacteroidota bacterium]
MITEASDKKYSLNRKIFLYFLGVAFLSVISLGSFWLESKLSDYNEEVALLRQNYSETKKLEIKNKILQVKDYLSWVQNAPLPAISKTLANQVTRLRRTPVSTGNIPETIPSAFRDSAINARVPVTVLDDNGKILYSFNPFESPENKKPGSRVAELLARVHKQKQGKGTVTFYRTIAPNDSVPEAVCCYDDGILPGCRVVSEVTADFFEGVLQVFFLDTISKLRFSKNEYVFVNTLSGNALITNGIYNRVPINILSSGNSAWIPVFNSQRSSSVHPEGVFYSYRWPKLTTSETSSKTSYFSYFPRWKWIIGTGFYEDDVNAFIDIRKKALFADLEGDIFHVLVYMLASSLLCYLLVLFFSIRLRQNIDLFADFFGKAAAGHLKIDISQVNYREFVNLALAANRMVDDRKKAETGLRKSEEKFSKLFRNSPDGIIILTPQGLITEVNDSMYRVTGYTRNELIGGSVVDLKLWHDPSGRDHYIGLMKERGQVMNLRADFRIKSGEVLNCLISGEIVEIDGNEYILSVIRDITEYKNMEAEVLGLEKRFRETLENIRLISVQLDLRGNVTFCNDYLLELTGFSREDVMGNNFFRLFIAEAMPVTEQLFLTSHSRGSISPFIETHARKKNGEELIIHLNNTLLRDAKGQVTGTTSIGEDVTERRRAEAELKKKMDELQRFHDLTVGRELTMIKLKKEVNELLARLGQPEKYRSTGGDLTNE